MIADIIKEVNDRVKSVVALDARAGLTVGGSVSDPRMKRAPLPCAWVFFAGDNQSNIEPIQSVKLELERMIFVKVLVAYSTEHDLLNISFPILDDVIKKITENPYFHNNICQSINYQGQTLEEINDRLVYVQRYVIDDAI